MRKVYILVCVNLQNRQETALFSVKFYTADKNFTQPPVATVATNLKSAFKDILVCWFLRGNQWLVQIKSLFPFVLMSDLSRKAKSSFSSHSWRDRQRGFLETKGRTGGNFPSVYIQSSFSPSENFQTPHF